MTYNIIRFMALQFKEIEEHKYFISEKEGEDVGMEYAMKDWYESGQAEIFHTKYFDHMDSIDATCEKLCNNNCGGLENCILSKELVHKLLEDGDKSIDYMCEWKDISNRELGKKDKYENDTINYKDTPLSYESTCFNCDGLDTTCKKYLKVEK